MNGTVITLRIGIGLNEAKSSSEFYKEGALGEHSKSLRLLLEIIKGVRR